MKAVNIEWDINEYDEEIELPTEIEIPEDVEEEDVSDYISDQTGFCHYGFELEV